MAASLAASAAETGALGIAPVFSGCLTMIRPCSKFELEALARASYAALPAACSASAEDEDALAASEASLAEASAPMVLS